MVDVDALRWKEFIVDGRSIYQDLRYFSNHRNIPYQYKLWKEKEVAKLLLLSDWRQFKTDTGRVYYVGRYGQIPQWEKPRIVKDYELWLAHVTRTHLGINYVEIKKRQLEWAVIDADAAAAPPVYPIHDSSAYIATATAAAELFLL